MTTEKKRRELERNRAKKEQELRKKEAEWEQTLSMSFKLKPYGSENSATKKVKEKAAVLLEIARSANRRLELERVKQERLLAQSAARPLETNKVPATTKKCNKTVYVGEMLERENKAQIEIAKKRLRVAPLFNKGAYGYITDETDPKTLGRK